MKIPQLTGKVIKGAIFTGEDLLLILDGGGTVFISVEDGELHVEYEHSVTEVLIGGAENDDQEEEKNFEAFDKTEVPRAFNEGECD